MASQTYNEIETLNKVLQLVYKWQKQARLDCHKDTSNNYKWGYTDGLKMATQVIAAEIHKAEQVAQKELAQ
jgi:hypothetical protein